MKFRQKIKNMSHIKPIIGVFLAIYLVTMIGVTCYKKSTFSEEVFRVVVDAGSLVEEAFQYKGGWDAEELTEEQKMYLKMLASRWGTNSSNKYVLMSCAIYDTEGNLITKSENSVGTEYKDEKNTKRYYYYNLDDFLTKKEIRMLAEYRWKIHKKVHETYEAWNATADYHFPVKVEVATGELAEISVCETKWEDTGLELLEALERQWEEHTWGVYRLTDEIPIWVWKNPKVAQGTEVIRIDDYGMIVQFPHLEYGMRYWEKWCNTERLHNYPEKIEQYENERCAHRFPLLLDGSDENSEAFQVLMRIETEPWKYALNASKEIYFYSFLFVAICGGIVIYAMDKTYKKRMAMEERRRDFTNAIAHELKTPLGVIRGFSENLAENVREEKREYYINSIIGQTEVMDELVQEMNYVSKLDSETLALKKESISLFTIIEEQLEKLKPIIDEKELKINYKIKGDFRVLGEKAYLEKAIWNLLSNACDYNRQKGEIFIAIDSSYCIIENTGDPIPEENLEFVCDMFYSGNKSRSKNKKHMGLGLYLAKKILDLHRVDMVIQNSQKGVKVVLTRKIFSKNR